MIDLYTWLTPNGRKLSIMLEEIGLPYRIFPINIGRGEQRYADFVDINPNGKIPAIIDQDGPDGRPLVLFESGAILLYLAEKSNQLLPSDAAERAKVIQWLFFQAANIGPMLGQAQHFFHYAEHKFDYSIERYVKEATRLYGVLNERLKRHEYIAGAAYTIADIATFPWLRAWKIQGVSISEFPHVERWLSNIGSRPAVIRERAVLSEVKADKSAPLEAAARQALFGQPLADQPHKE